MRRLPLFLALVITMPACGDDGGDSMGGDDGSSSGGGAADVDLDAPRYERCEAMVSCEQAMCAAEAGAFAECQSRPAECTDEDAINAAWFDCREQCNTTRCAADGSGSCPDAEAEILVDVRDAHVSCLGNGPDCDPMACDRLLE